MNDMTAVHQQVLPRVLLLDDDPFMLSMLRDMLEEIGSFEILCEPEARSALLTLGERPPDLMICDLSLPDMDGIEFMQAAAQAGYDGDVVLLSGLDAGVLNAATSLAHAHGLRVLGAFEKPLALATLRRVTAPLAAAHG